MEVAGQVLVVPTQRECEAVAEAMEPLDFVKSALGGDFTCLSSPGEDSTCCEKVGNAFCTITRLTGFCYLNASRKGIGIVFYDMLLSLGQATIFLFLPWASMVTWSGT